MKCFYVYHEEDACFDCGVARKDIFGYYRGEPNEAAMMKIAKQIYKDLDPEQFEKQVKVYKYTIVYDNGWSKTVHEAEEFELKDASSEEDLEMSNKIATEKSIVADCIKKKLNKIRECLKKGYKSIKREDLSQLCIIEEGNVNQFLAWDEENTATPLHCTKNDLIDLVIKTMNKKGVDANHYVIDDVVVEWLSKQFNMDLEHVLWYFSY